MRDLLEQVVKLQIIEEFCVLQPVTSKRSVGNGTGSLQMGCYRLAGWLSIVGMHKLN